jgi:hypothetical protein
MEGVMDKNKNAAENSIGTLVEKIGNLEADIEEADYIADTVFEDDDYKTPEEYQLSFEELCALAQGMREHADRLREQLQRTKDELTGLMRQALT